MGDVGSGDAGAPTRGSQPRDAERRPSPPAANRAAFGLGPVKWGKRGGAEPPALPLGPPGVTASNERTTPSRGGRGSGGTSVRCRGCGVGAAAELRAAAERRQGGRLSAELPAASRHSARSAGQQGTLRGLGGERGERSQESPEVVRL